jgi:hypothetical protein
MGSKHFDCGHEKDHANVCSRCSKVFCDACWGDHQCVHGQRMLFNGMPTKDVMAFLKKRRHLEGKHYFAEGVEVRFDMGPGMRGRGRIRGLASEGLIDMWIVEVEWRDDFDTTTYPWSSIVVPYTALSALHLTAKV